MVYIDGPVTSEQVAEWVIIQAALFNFQSLLLVILLLICTSAYAHGVFPGIIDRNKDGCALSSLSLVYQQHLSLVHLSAYSFLFMIPC